MYNIKFINVCIDFFVQNWWLTLSVIYRYLITEFILLALMIVCIYLWYKGHFINNAQGGKTAEWMMQSQWKWCQLQLKTWGSRTCVHHIPSLRCFELMSVRNGVCRRLGYCASWRSKIIHQNWNFTRQKPHRNSQCFAWSLWWADSGP